MICAPHSRVPLQPESFSRRAMPEERSQPLGFPFPAGTEPVLDNTARCSFALGELMTYLQLQLKVCEGCGALWLRTHGRTDIYCFSCESKHLPIRTHRRALLSSRIESQAADRFVPGTHDQHADLAAQRPGIALVSHDEWVNVCRRQRQRWWCDALHSKSIGDGRLPCN